MPIRSAFLPADRQSQGTGAKTRAIGTNSPRFQRLSRAVMTYISDLVLLGTAMLPHMTGLAKMKITAASLDPCDLVP